MAVLINLPLIAFNTGVADGNGITWWIQEMEGWDSAPVRQTVTPVTGRHGAIMAESYLDPRPITLKGIVKAPNETGFWLAYNQLDSAIANLFSTISLKVTEGPTVKFVNVVKGGPVRKSFLGVGAIQFEMPMLAVDPLKYSDALNAQGIPSTVNNLGNFETLPDLVVTSGTNLTITNTTQGSGASLVLNGVGAGDIINMKDRTVRSSGGTDKYSTVQIGSVWWGLLPGNNVITVSGGTLDVSWRHAWL